MIAYHQFMAQPIEQELATYYTDTYRKSGVILGYLIIRNTLIIKYLDFSAKANNCSLS